LLSRGLAVAQRYECKYLITEAQAAYVRAFAQCYLVPDEHVVPALGNEYPVYSLYLDSRDLHTYYSSVAGHKDRFKLRVRFYDARADTPAFLEVKSRRNDVVVKERARVRKEAVGRLLTSFYASPDDLLEDTPEDRAGMERFCELCAKLQARPRVMVRYLREPYTDPAGGPLRVTIDRFVACLRTDAARLEADGPGWVDLPDLPVVLEIKFTETFPAWLSQMVREVGLVRVRSPKYVRSVDALTSLGIGVA